MSASKAKYKSIYEDIVKFIKSKGAKVVHRKKMPTDGSFSSVSNTIYIWCSLKYTHYGCFVLLHEYIHSLQSKSAKYDRFFSRPKKCSEKKMEQFIDYVERVERDTDRRAHRLLLKKWGLWHTPNDVDYYREEWRAYWRKHYFNKS